MKSAFEIIFSKETLYLVVLFILSILGMDFIESKLITKDTLYPALIFIIPVIAWFFLFVKPTIKK